MSAVRYSGRRGPLVRPLVPFGPEIAVVALADWLFWDYGVGLSLAVFCVTLAVTAHLRRPCRSWRPPVLALLILAAGLAPAVERLAPLSVAFALLAPAAAADLALPLTPSIPRASLEAAARWISGPRRYCQDIRRHAHWRRRHRASRSLDGPDDSPGFCRLRRCRCSWPSSPMRTGHRRPALADTLADVQPADPPSKVLVLEQRGGRGLARGTPAAHPSRSKPGGSDAGATQA